jgi:oligoribonuclease (3'-5' exoribonuclease)
MAYDVMIDIETTGINPFTNGILQIAAWKFDYHTGEVGDHVDIATQLAPNRMWDESTIKWWQDSPDRLAHLQVLRRTGVPAREGFQALKDWVGNDRQGIRMWAKPSTFEYPFLQSHFTQLDIQMPFHYRYCRDINTHISALIGDPGANTYAITIPFEGMPHNALWDSLHDMRCLLEAKRLYGRPIQEIIKDA